MVKKINSELGFTTSQDEQTKLQFYMANIFRSFEGNDERDYVIK